MSRTHSQRINQPTHTHTKERKTTTAKHMLKRTVNHTEQSQICQNAQTCAKLNYIHQIPSRFGCIVKTCPSHWLRFYFHGSHR